ncbi:hypothetical protein [Streptomyces sp. NPDC057909]|uniref:hypothetical protein n=1 Tax=Streptomyces sp. NPDC057909 TaxID=3346277 RepID=UPI0036E9F77E
MLKRFPGGLARAFQVPLGFLARHLVAARALLLKPLAVTVAGPVGFRQLLLGSSGGLAIARIGTTATAVDGRGVRVGSAASARTIAVLSTDCPGAAGPDAAVTTRRG